MLHAHNSRAKRYVVVYLRRWAVGAALVIAGVPNSCQNGVHELMPATVITGVYNPSGATINWPVCVAAGPFDGYAVVPNVGNVALVLNSASIGGGGNPGDFSFDATQLPVTLQPGQSAIIHVRFAPSGAGVR